MKYEMYKDFIENISDEVILNYLMADLDFTEEDAKDQLERFTAHQDIYDEFKLWFYNFDNRRKYHESEEYDNFALGFDFAVEEPVTEQELTANDISVKFGNSDVVNLNAVIVCNLLIGLREDPEKTLDFIEKEVKTSVNPKYPFEKKLS